MTILQPNLRDENAARWPDALHVDAARRIRRASVASIRKRIADAERTPRSHFASLSPHGFHRVVYFEWGDPANRAS